VASPEEQQKFIDNCSLESHSSPPHLDMLHCPRAIDAFTNNVKGGTTTSTGNSIGNSNSENAIDSEITRLSNEADLIKSSISLATFTPGNGVVKDLINKVEYYSGGVCDWRWNIY
jgi:hypothetical protein